jgi:DNA-binding PadR family transcriptional regulator
MVTTAPSTDDSVGTARPNDRAGQDLTSRAYWTGTIKMSLSKLFILAALAEGPKHGYEVARRVEAMTRGCCSPSEGTIYPSLREFEAGGYVTAEETTVGGRRRKVYTMTERGRRAHRVAVEAWLEIAGALTDAGRALEGSLLSSARGCAPSSCS